MREKDRAVVCYLAVLPVLMLLTYCRSALTPAPAFLRCGIVYGTYLSLILLWMYAMQARITQGNIRRFLMGEGGLMCFGILVRFVQEAFLQNHILYLRFSGHLVSATVLPILLCGLYGSLGLGEGEGYSLPRRWYLLTIPTALLVLLDLTDEMHHLVFRLLPGDPYPNIEFHPYVGLVLIVILGFIILALRLRHILRRSFGGGNTLTLRAALALAEFPLVLLFLLPYAFSSFYNTPELLEFFAGLYYLEVFSWEIYVFVGLVPVNTQYPSVFEHATVGMQIVEPDGSISLRSCHSETVTGEMFRILQAEGTLLSGDTELHMHENRDSGLIWQRDISELQRAVRELEAVEADLIQEGQLLEEEYRARSEETRVAAQDRIYSRLSRECASQLSLMQELAKKCRNSADNTERYQTLLVIGTYVKRRCQLRLTVREDGNLEVEDVRLTCEDMMRALQNIGIDAYCRWEIDPANDEKTADAAEHSSSADDRKDADSGHDAEYWIGGLDFLEEVLEQNHFRAGRFELRVTSEEIACAVEEKRPGTVGKIAGNEQCPTAGKNAEDARCGTSGNCGEDASDKTGSGSMSETQYKSPLHSIPEKKGRFLRSVRELPGGAEYIMRERRYDG